MNAIDEFKIARIPTQVNVPDSAEYEVGKRYRFIDQPVFFIVKEILNEVDLAVFTVRVDEVMH